MNAYPETPDNWIERQPEDDGPQMEDACTVCDKIDCVCPPEDEREAGYNRSQFGHAGQ